MVVIEPNIPGHYNLPGTVEELRRIEEHVPSEHLHKFGIPGCPGSVNNVLSHLPAASIFHFAGTSSRSSLLLEDGKLNISQIMGQPLPHASLAFLSACDTAVGDEDLADDAIHLAATMLFAGFRGVVATMW